MEEEAPWADMNLWQRMSACHRYFQILQPGTERIWEEAERRGTPIDARRKTYQTIRNELGGAAGMQIAWQVIQWQETENPAHIDMALMTCEEHGFPLTPTLQIEVMKAAKIRLTGRVKAQRTPGKVRNAGRKSAALQTMANLIFAGLTRKQAASKAARHVGGYKPSALEKFYDSTFAPELEAYFFAQWSKDKSGHNAIWLPAISEMPDTPEHLAGNRR